ncbi:ATP-binding protein [Rufibacter sediminis]|uniref:histidine kinase n=1 Tax=Rufibacter sediminis TaxID=2762756 RepID=A0ABR6VPJ2_9BACT|nr:ATP-binding protein [Rufibacter sediminis]MBC3538793.1 PAS domain-containing protein [Rufibacter sediminis]
MKLKTKILLGYLVVLALLLGLGSYNLYNLSRLDRAAQNILKDNLYSVQLGQEMNNALSHLLVTQQQAVFLKADSVEIAESTRADLRRFEASLQKESENITEPGERETVESMRQTFAELKRLLHTSAAVPSEAYFVTVMPKHQLLQDKIHQMVSLNTDALQLKNQQAQETSQRVWQYTLALLACSVLFALVFCFSVPEALTQPIQQLITSLEYVAQRNFSQTLPIKGNDEFGAVSKVFNQMLVRLREYEKSTLSELITEKNRIQSIITNLDEAIILLDAEGKIILANPVACRLLGLPPEKLIGAKTQDVAAQNDLFKELLKGIEAGSSDSPEAVLSITDLGEEAYYRKSVFQVLAYNEVLGKQEFAGYILSLRNVSDFKKLDQVKSNFLATVSHELKTPLASINYSLKLLQNQRIGEMNDEQQHLVATIKTENQRLQKMVTELLDVARLENGNIQLNIATANVADIVQFAANTIQLQLREKNIHLEISLPPQLPPVKADVEKTSWVLLNLLSNAIRYSAQNETIVLSASEGKGEVVVQVKDHGPGIEPQNHERIFQRFVQVPGKEAYKGGSGLGLSISREFIQTQGGRIWVESEVGQGSTFGFTLTV